MSTMKLPKKLAIKSLNLLIAECELAEQKLLMDLKPIRKLKKDALKALSQTKAAKGMMVEYKKRNR